jgi:hypothetical protein
MGTFTGTAGEALTDGQICYIKSDGKYGLAKADVVGTMPGVAIAAASIANNATGNFYKFGEVTLASHGFTVGATLYVSAVTAGLKTTTAPSTSGYQVQKIGWVQDANTIMFYPELTIIEVP